MNAARTPPSASSPSNPHPKVMIWFDSFGTWGPLSVVDRLTRALLDKGCEVCIVTSERSLEGVQEGQRWRFSFQNDPKYANAKVQIVTPYNELGDYGRKHQTMTPILNAEAARFKPDIVMTEQYPFISVDEGLGDFLRDAKAANPQLKTYSIARDVPDFADDQVREDAIKGASLFDKILVRGDKKLLDYRQFFKPDQWDAIKEVVAYPGYFIPAGPPKSGKTPAVQPQSNEVLVSAGGSFSEADFELYAQLLHARAKMPADLRNKQWHFVVGSKDSDVWRDLQKIVDDLPAEDRAHVSLEAHSPNFSHVLRTADMVITRGGLTSVEATHYGRPTLIVTQASEDASESLHSHDRGHVDPDDSDDLIHARHEQVQRAEALAKKFPHHVSLVDQRSDRNGYAIQPMELMQALTDAHERQHAHAKPVIAVDGHETVAKGVLAVSQGQNPSFNAGRKR